MTSLDRHHTPPHNLTDMELNQIVPSSCSSSNPYAEMESVTPRRMPYPHQFQRGWWHRISRSSFGRSLRGSFRRRSSSRRGNRSRRERLRHVRRKLHLRNKTLAKALAFMLLLFTITLTPLLALYPQLLEQVLHQFSFSSLLTPSARLFSSECQAAAEKYFSADRYHRCHRSWRSSLETRHAGGVGNDQSCGLDVGVVLCLVTETKGDLDHRTERLHQSVDSLSDSTHRLLQNLTNTASESNISALYNYRPSIHLLLYYSAEVNQERIADTLKWRGRPGLISAHSLETTHDGHQTDICTGFRVTHPGYYYIYSHVTYQAPDRADLMLVHAVLLNNKTVLQSISVSTTGTSYLNGVFLLRRGDVVKVNGSYSYIDKKHAEKTFFGAYQI